MIEAVNEYAAAQSGAYVTVRTAALQWMLLQYDLYFFYGGTPWKLAYKRKGPGVYTVWREPRTEEDRAAIKAAKKEANHES